MKLVKCTYFYVYIQTGYWCNRYCTTGIYDTKSEIFSYGVVLAELLTCKLQGINHVYHEADSMQV